MVTKKRQNTGPFEPGGGPAERQAKVKDLSKKGGDWEEERSRALTTKCRYKKLGGTWERPTQGTRVGHWWSRKGKKSIKTGSG